MRIADNIKTEEIERRLETLPDELAAAFENSQTGRVVFEAGKKLGLPIDRIGEVNELVGYTLLGFVKSADFIPHIAEIVGDPQKATELGTAINQNIFLPIREAMARAYPDQWAGKDSAPPALTAQAPKPRPSQTPPPPPLKPQSVGPPAVPPKPEPLIIHPLPSQPKEPRDRGQGLGDRSQMPVVTPPPAIKPTAPVAPQAAPPKPAEKPEAPKAPPPPPPPSATGGTAPPVMSPPGTRMAMPPVRPKPEIPKAGPPPPPPSAAYERAKATVEQELAVLRQPPEPPPPALPTTRELLRQEIEKFRQPAAGDSMPKPAPTTPPGPKPLKLPSEKIPKPQAPEKYAVDPYKEPTE